MSSKVGQKNSQVDEDEFPPGYLETNIFVNKICERIIPIAILAIALLITGGLLLHFHVNTIAAGLLMGGGGVIAVGDLVYGVKDYIDLQKELKDQ